MPLLESVLTKQSEVTEIVTAIDKPNIETSQVAAPQVQEEGETPSTSNVLRAAYDQYNIVGQTQRFMNQEFTPASSWSWEDNKEELIKDVEPQFQEELSGADSLETAQRIKGEILEEQVRLKTLRDGGLGGTAASIGAMLLDPTMVIGFGAMSSSYKTTRVAKLLAEGAVTAAIPTGMEAYMNAETDAGDVMVAALVGAGVGSTLGGLSLLGKQSNDIIQGATTDATKHAVARHASAAETKVDYRMTMTGTEEELIEGADDWAAVHKIQRGSKVSKTIDNIAAKFPSIGKTDSTNLWNAKSSVAQKFTHDMAESGSGVFARSDTAAQMKDLTERKFMSHFMPTYEDNLKGWNANKGVKGNVNQATQFNHDVRIELENKRRAHIDGTEFTPSTNPHIAKAADDWQAMVDDVLNDAKSAEVKGFDEIERVPGYVPLSWDGTKLRSLDPVTYKSYKNLLTNSYISVGIPSEVAQEISNAVLDRTGRKELRLDSNVSALFSGDAAAELKTLLGEENFSKVAAIVKGKADDAGKAGSAKRRTDVDLTRTNSQGLSLLDIVNNDLQFVGSKYSQEMAGRVSLANKGIKSEADYQRILEAALKQESERGGSIELVRNSMNSVYNQLLSRPQDGVGVHKGMRRFMDFASVSMLGGMGLAQLAEYGPILAQVGLKNAMKDIKMMNPANFKKSVESDLLVDLQSLMGKIGQEEILYSPYVRLEDAAGESSSATVNAMLKRVDDGLARATHLNGILSLNNTIKRHQQRMAVTLGASKAVRMIREGKHIDNKFFDEIGLSKGTVKEIQKRIESGDITFGSNGSLDGLNLVNWSVESGNNFAVSMNRHMHQVVQKSLAGENSFWMGSTMGSMVTQFRNYPIAAMGKQLGRAMRQGTGTTAGLFTYSTLTAALAYNVKLAVQNKDTSTMSTEDHVAGIMQMSSPSGLLPDIASATMQMMGAGEYQSRLGNYSNPVLSVGGAAVQLPQIAIKTVKGEDLTKGDINTIQAVTPFSNILGVSALTNQIKKGM